jgi:hypothetical protein
VQKALVARPPLLHARFTIGPFRGHIRAASGYVERPRA